MFNMKGFTFSLIFLAILGTSYSKVIKAEDTLENVDPFVIGDCWYDTNPQDSSDTKFMCETTGGALQVGDFGTPEKCQEQCVTLGDGGCKFWAFTNLRNSDPKCYALVECYQDTQNHCTPTIDDLATCASGPRVCDTDCAQLTYAGGLDKAHWDCIHTGDAVRPYQADIPSGSICTAECPVWKDSGDQLVPSVSAKCKPDGTWEVPSPVVAPTPIGKPDVDPNPACACDPIKIDPATFETTDNLGAELYCTGEDGTGDLVLMKSAFTIQKMMNCIFLCDKQFVLETACTQGTWTNLEAKDCTDFYCWNKPAVGDCGGSP